MCCRHLSLTNRKYSSMRVVLMVKVHWVLMVCSLACIVLHNRGLSSHVVAALPRTWPELITCLTNFIPASKGLAKDVYIAMRQLELTRVVLVEPSWWLAWLIAITDKARPLHAICIAAEMHYAVP